jgi:hypothetical protein
MSILDFKLKRSHTRAKTVQKVTSENQFWSVFTLVECETDPTIFDSHAQNVIRDHSTHQIKSTAINNNPKNNSKSRKRSPFVCCLNVLKSSRLDSHRSRCAITTVCLLTVCDGNVVSIQTKPFKKLAARSRDTRFCKMSRRSQGRSKSPSRNPGSSSLPSQAKSDGTYLLRVYASADKVLDRCGDRLSVQWYYALHGVQRLLHDRVFHGVGSEQCRSFL